MSDSLHSASGLCCGFGMGAATFSRSPVVTIGGHYGTGGLLYFERI